MDEDINYDNVKMEMSEDSDSDRRSASSDQSINRKSSRYSTSSQSSRYSDSSLGSEDGRSSRARSEARSPLGLPDKYEPSAGRGFETPCTNAVGKDERLKDENHSMNSCKERRLSLSPRDRMSRSGSSSESSDDSDDSCYREKRQSPKCTKGENEHHKLGNVCRESSLGACDSNRSKEASCQKEKSVDHSDSPFEKYRKLSRSPSFHDNDKRSRSPSSSKSKGGRSPSRSGNQRRSRSPLEYRAHSPRISPERSKGHHSTLYTDRRKRSRSPERKSRRSSPSRRDLKRSRSPCERRSRRSCSPRELKRHSSAWHDKNQNRKSRSPRDTKTNQSRSPCNRDKQSRSPERCGNKNAKQSDGPVYGKIVTNSSPRHSKQPESPKREDAGQSKSLNSRDRHAKRSGSSSDEEAQKKLRSSTSRDEKDRKRSPGEANSEMGHKSDRDRKRSPSDRKRSRSRSHGRRNSRHKHCSPVEDSGKSSHRRRSSSRHRSRSPHASSHSRHSSHRRSQPRSRSRGLDDIKPRPRRTFEKKPSKLSILEKLGIEIRPSSVGPSVTPQQLLQQSIELQMQQVKSSTGIELPSYYNPAAVNPARYAEQIQKRRLLWGNKVKEQDKKPEAVVASAECAPSVSNNQWEATTFAQDQDGKMTAKFKRLMGIKETAASAPAAASVDSNTLLQKQEELFTSMEMQYEVARLATHTQRGVGLGYGTFQYPR